MRLTLELAKDGLSLQVRAEYSQTTSPEQLADAVWQIVLDVLEEQANLTAPAGEPTDPAELAEPVEPAEASTPRPPGDLLDLDAVQAEVTHLAGLRDEALHLLDAGVSEMEICARLCISARTLHRWDARAALTTITKEA